MPPSTAQGMARPDGLCEMILACSMNLSETSLAILLFLPVKENLPFSYGTVSCPTPIVLLTFPLGLAGMSA